VIFDFWSVTSCPPKVTRYTYYYDGDTSKIKYILHRQDIARARLDPFAGHESFLAALRLLPWMVIVLSF